MHINNLYKNQTVLLFRECYALEKIDGTHASVAWRDGRVWFSPGCVPHAEFAALFDEEALAIRFQALGLPCVTVHGEAYGGKVQQGAWRYGDLLRFVAYDVHVVADRESWLSVPAAEKLVAALCLPFVHYARVQTDLAMVDAERDAPSEQARRNGVEGDKPREGVVLRPLVEMTTNDGRRIIAKHKRDDERETRTPRPVVDPKAFEVLTEADAIAEEWVTPKRLEHVIAKLTRAPDVQPDGQEPTGLSVRTSELSISDTRRVVDAMVEDVLREGAGEIVDSKSARVAIGHRASALFHAHLRETKTR